MEKCQLFWLILIDALHFKDREKVQNGLESYKLKERGHFLPYDL